MMMGLLAMGDAAPGAALLGNGVLPGQAAQLPAEAGVPQPALLGDFEHLLADDIALAAPADTATDAMAELDAWVAQALAQALETEAPVELMPALQDGVMTAPWLMQALDQRDAGAAVAALAATDEDALALPMQPQGRAAMQPALQPGGLARGVVDLAALQQTSVAEGVAPALADRLFNHRQGAANAAAVQDAAADASTQVLNVRTGGERALPTTLSVMTLDGMGRTGTVQPDQPAASADVKAPNAPTEAQQKLVDALGERLSVQTAQGMRQAVIRLDPHLNGSVRIELRQDANGIAVHLSATNADVVRQLQAIGESLRQDLGARNGGEVTVQVSASRQGGQADADASGRERQARDDSQEQGPGRGLWAEGGDQVFEMASLGAARMQRETR